ncbi:hypothetical protein TCAL_15855 [Tigriopus californicus]|uniref:Uncharacterized protein n=1 Tax=Tigriopus californicus TaxID=6832 RepID=A0A553NR32_TIGCA|nr:hypothetical protein TCAL_15855 [Tigriopus californicus]
MITLIPADRHFATASGRQHGRINHGHETTESKSLNGEVDVVLVEGIALRELVGRQFKVTEAEHTLSQTSQFHFCQSKWLRWIQGLHSFQILDQAILGGHSLGGQSQAHGDSGQKALWHVSDNDTNQEDDGIQPMVFQNEGNDEEGDSQEHGHTSDNVNEMGNLFGNGRVSTLQTRGQTSNTSHDSVVANVDDNTSGSSFHSVGREKGQVLGLQGIFMREFGASGLGFRFSGKRRVVDLEASCLNHSNISRYSVAKLDLDDVSQSEFLSLDGELLTVTESQSILGHEILEGFHNLGGLGLLVNLVKLLLSHVFEFSSMNNGRVSLTRIDFFNGDVQTGCDIFDSLISFRDDSDRFGNGLGTLIYFRRLWKSQIARYSSGWWIMIPYLIVDFFVLHLLNYAVTKIKIEKGSAGNHQFSFNGYIFRPLSMPGVYERRMAKQVSKTNPKFNIQLLMPCWNTEFLRVLQMTMSAHWTTTMETKKAMTASNQWYPKMNAMRKKVTPKKTATPVIK